MAELNEQELKIRNWLEKNSFYAEQPTWPKQPPIRDTLKAAGIETDLVAIHLNNLLAIEENSYILTGAIRLAGLLRDEVLFDQLSQLVFKDGKYSGFNSILIKTLGKINSKKAISLGFELLKDERAKLRAMAVGLLAEQQTRESILALLELLKNEQDQYVKWITIGTLTDWHVKEVITVLILMLENQDQDTFTIQNVLKRLGQLRAEEAFPQVIEFLKHSKEKVRSQNSDLAVHVLGTREVKAWTPEFMSWLESEDSWLRYIGLLVLENWNVRPTDAVLIDLLKDKDAQVRRSVIQPLWKWKIRGAIPQLIETLKDSDQYAREWAAKALQIMGAKEAVPHLLKILKEDFPALNKDQYYRGYNGFYKELALALESLGDETVHELIQPELAEVRAEFKRQAEILEKQRNGDYF
jgi:HEAT repeat protein